MPPNGKRPHAVDAAAHFDDAALRQDARAYLQRWSISENELARAIGMSTGNIHRWFRCEGRISTDFAASLASVCDLDLNRYICTADLNVQ